MRILNQKVLREFVAEHRQSEYLLKEWRQIVKKAAWKNFAEAKADFPEVNLRRFPQHYFRRHSDRPHHWEDDDGVKSPLLKQTCTVFHVGENNVRVVTDIDYKEQTVDILGILEGNTWDY